MMVNAVIVGGTDTTRNQLGMALSLFAEHPKQWDRLARDPSLASSAVEEVMRYAGAVRGTGRFASEDIEYKGVLFPAGTLMFPALAASNRTREIRYHPRANINLTHDLWFRYPLLPRGTTCTRRTPGSICHPLSAFA
jgi:cytochrome P450